MVTARLWLKVSPHSFRNPVLLSELVSDLVFPSQLVASVVAPTLPAALRQPLAAMASPSSPLAPSANWLPCKQATSFNSPGHGFAPILLFRGAVNERHGGGRLLEVLPATGPRGGQFSFLDHDLSWQHYGTDLVS